ncbi:MAG: response regulator [Proteobacteria bacterium]|nr:response regulator [Pseudomonadota bacterium]MBU1739443.1 response regulator [Pseudomonadota bacterium]
MRNDNQILLVDDEEAIRSLLKEILEPEGLVVTMAADGEEALAKFREQYFDLVLLDLSLPDINGIELLKRFKTEQPLVGVIIITGHAEMLTFLEASRQGADDYLLKPFDSKELVVRIANCIEKKRHEKTLRMHEEILAVSADLVILISPGRRILLANDAFSRTVHCRLEDLDAELLYDLFGQELYTREMKKALSYCFRGNKCEHQGVLAGKDGRSGFYHFSYSPVVGSDGKVSAVVLSMRDLTEYNAVVQQLRDSEERLHLAMDISSDGVWDRNLVTGETVYGENWAGLLGYTLAELKEGKITFQNLLHPDDREKTIALSEEHIRGKTERYVAEFRLRTKKRGWRWILARGQVVERDAGGKPLRFMGTHTDITRQKELEFRLRAFAEHLEEVVEKRTRELARKSENLEEVNIALTVLLRKRDQDKKELEEQMVSNVRSLIVPYLEKLKNCELSDREQSYLDAIETNLDNITSPFMHRLSVHHRGYTPTEIQVANYIKDGKTSKEIAEIMNLSPETISNHRKNIRKKSGIANKKVNLRTALLSLVESRSSH